MSARKRRRADGTLRPAYRRYLQRRRRNRPNPDTNPTPERLEWLSQFEDGDRARFFVNAVRAKAIWLRAFSAELGLPEEEAWPLLEKTADERRWMKLRTREGKVVGIAPPKKKQHKVGRLLTRAELLERQAVAAAPQESDGAAD